MSTEGPCALEIEVFKRESSRCNAMIHSEGKKHIVVLMSLSMAATHVMLRRILTSAAPTNATLSGFLRQYLAHYIASTMSDSIPSDSPDQTWTEKLFTGKE